MKGFALLLSILIKISEGAMDVAFSDNPAAVGDAVIITCTKDSTLVSSVSWFNARYDPITLSLCSHTMDQCIPSISNADDRYLFSSDYTKRKFTMTISKVEQADAGVYTCKDFSSDKGNATLKVQTGVTEDGGLSEEQKTKIGIGCGGGGAVCVGVVILHFSGYLIGIWSFTVLIPEKDYPHIKFEDVLILAMLNAIMKETKANIFICGKGSDKYAKIEEQDHHSACLWFKSLPDNDQPLHVYVRALYKIRAKRAVLKIKELHEAFTTPETVLIPEREFLDVLTRAKLKTIMEETGANIIIRGKGSDMYYGTTGQEYKSLPLQAYVTGSKISVERAVLKIKELHEAFTTPSITVDVHKPSYRAVNSVEPRVHEDLFPADKIMSTSAVSSAGNKSSSTLSTQVKLPPRPNQLPPIDNRPQLKADKNLHHEL